MVIFDWDGVLCDSLATFHHLYRKNVDQINLCEFKKITSKRAPDEQLLPGRLLKYKNALLHTKLFPGVKAVIRSLNTHGIKTIIVSTNKSYIIKSILKRTDSLRYVSKIYGSDYRIKKPDKRLLRIIEKKFSIRQPEMLYVGDDIVDILFIKASRIVPLFVSYGYTGKDSLSGKLAENGISSKNLVSKSKHLLSKIRMLI